MRNIIEIQVTPELDKMADREAMSRLPFMNDKCRAKDDPKRIEGARAGFRIERPVKEWFKSYCPTIYKPPPNENDYTQPSNYDFYLDGLCLEIDVSGKHADGTFGIPKTFFKWYQKPPADIYLFACRNPELENQPCLLPVVQILGYWETKEDGALPIYVASSRMRPIELFLEKIDIHLKRSRQV